MGLSVLGVLIALGLSLLAQSPQALKRIGLGGSTLDQRARTFTTYAFALMILALGFFLAGVPLGPESQTADQNNQDQPTAAPTSGGEQVAAENEAMEESTSTPPLTPETGAFGGPPPDLASPTSSQPVTPSSTITDEVPLANGTTAPTATAEPEETEAPTNTPEPTLTPTPTETPVPTLTPTPIISPTAVIDIGGGNIWIQRSPGGQNLVILSSGDTVIPLNGVANQGGLLWRKIKTVDGVVGWIQQDFLVIE